MVATVSLASVMLALQVTAALSWVPPLRVQAPPVRGVGTLLYTKKNTCYRSNAGFVRVQHDRGGQFLAAAQVDIHGGDHGDVGEEGGGDRDREKRRRGLRGLLAAVRFPRFGLRKKNRQRGGGDEEEAPPVYRSVRSSEPLPCWPIWPIQNGIIMNTLDKLQLQRFAAKLEDLWGGRVGKISMEGDDHDFDPFILFAHHRHSFWPFDPIRPLSRWIMPEGFPAHPHRGFQTVTYVMKGRMIHRDSLGMKQVYGAGQVQWLSAGRGIMHEEMWDVKDWAKLDVDIYQIWVNLPSYLKMTRPRIQLVGKDTDNPLPIVKPSKGTEVVVIAGELCGETSPVETMQPLSMLHIAMAVGAESWSHRVPEGHQCMIYVRKGDLTIVPTEEGYYEGEEDRGPQGVATKHVAFLAFDGEHVRFDNRGDEDLDFMLIEAEPTGENVAARGNYVMNTERELDQAVTDEHRGYFGRPWDHRLKDTEWRETLQGANGKRTSYRRDTDA